MDTESKIRLLGPAAQYDVCRACGLPAHVADDIGQWIYPALTPGGCRISLLRILQSNVCQGNCGYCAFRSGRDVRRATFTPDELAKLFDALVRRRMAQALFLSSGVVRSTSHATDRMLATVELLRTKYAFQGYVHLKILPGADDASIEASLKLASRVSVNLEAPNPRRIGTLSGTKDYVNGLMRPLIKAHALRRRLGRDVSIATQFVVGAAGETDREILATTHQLYRQLHLARVYYSAFQPIERTPLDGLSPTPAWRERRLYQADYLLRQYGFGFRDLVFEGDKLPKHADPKTLWARAHPEHYPVEVNTAPMSELLRVPGIGPRSARRIAQRRTVARLREWRDLGLRPTTQSVAGSYLLINGRRPDHQLSLWSSSEAGLRPLDREREARRMADWP